jgi:SIR2-like domain
MGIERNNILFLLGAGCSANAGIPVSGEMVANVHRLVEEDARWQPYRDLYYYLRSSIQFADGIFGNFQAVFNIEKLLIVMAEIEKKERNPVYPFIGAWSNRLLDLAGSNFKRVTELRDLITQELVTHWVKPSAYREAAYYDGFKNLQFGATGLGFNVKVFSLNYDLCFEKRVGKENIELGFDENTSEWSYNNFARDEDKSYTLYKLHGSLDWFIDNSTQKLMQSDDTAREPALIFGVSNKLRAIDPYLFYIYEFRRHCFSPDLRLLVCIGYSFADDHINDIIAQAIKNNSQARVLATMYSNKVEEQLSVRKALGLAPDSEQIIFEKTDAKKFLAETLSKEYLAQQFLPMPDSPFAP